MARVKPSRILEVGANVGIVAVSALLVANFLWSRSAERSPQDLVDEEIKVGKPLRVAGVDWKSYKSTLVLVFKKDCSFCMESVPFYEELTRVALASGVHVIALVPEPLNESERVLATERVSVDVVKPLNQVTPRIRRTPTLLLVNGLGVIERVWLGRVPEAAVPGVFKAVLDKKASAAVE